MAKDKGSCVNQRGSSWCARERDGDGERLLPTKGDRRKKKEITGSD